MNYILKVSICNIDKVILKLMNNDIKIKNVLRSNGCIYITTKFLNKINSITEILEVKKDSRILSQF
jgi:hypothetical protein